MSVNLSEMVVGRIPVLECLRARVRPARRLYLLRGAKDLHAVREAAAGVPISEVDREELGRLAKGALHQGVVLQAAPLPLRNLKEWLASLQEPQALAVVLDGIEDPHNFGAIVRSAAACGAAGVIFGKDRSAPLSSVALKSAAGAMEHIPLVCVSNIRQALEQLKERQFWVAALEAHAETVLWDADLSGRIALVIGSEGKGVRRLVYEHCDFQLRIPLTGPITSLNASVSAGIALAECLRQQRKENA